MRKIKINKEWFMDNKVAINCKTKEESVNLVKELQKLSIDINFDVSEAYEYYGNETCYNCYKSSYNNDSYINYSPINYYETNNYLILNFSDLEFESDTIKNEPEITKYENEECGYDLPVEVDKSDKNHILRGDVKLNSGDIIKSKNDSIGLVVGDCISWCDGGWDEAETGYDLEWIIPSESLKIDKGYEVGRLLFKGELKDSLKDLIIYVEDDKPKKVETRIYHISVSENRSEYRSFCISNNPTIEIGDIVSIDKGLYSGRYGIVISTKYEEISEEDIKKHYSNITKIK